MPIKFGTDGWRAIIAEDYTFENVRYCAQGAASLMQEQSLGPRGLVLGYDTRFGSEDFAAAVAEVTAANGILTYLCDKAAPTPVVSHNLVQKRAGSGIVITASHNPRQWNGFKFKPDYGGSASPEVVEALEAHIARAEKSRSVKRTTLRKAIGDGIVKYIDPEPSYLKHLATLVDLEFIRRAGLKVMVDSMHGAGSGYIARLLSGGATVVDEIRAERNPAFPDMEQPEPITQNLKRLMSSVPSESAHDAQPVGVAVCS